MADVIAAGRTLLGPTKRDGGSTRWSPEVRVLLHPAAAYRELAGDASGGWWVLLRRPVLLAVTLGCGVSMLASGRMSARLIFDGALSFAFVPVFEMAGLAAVYRRGPRPRPLARAIDLFFAANAPWLVWMIGVAALDAVLSPRQVPLWTVPPRIWIVFGPLVPVIAWSAVIDFHFFREVLQRTPRAAVGDVILQRAVAWPCAIVYFLAYAGWADIVGRLGG